MIKSGFVAVVGKPNVGKSTLINNLIGKKVSIVSPKAQTTRNKIMGVLNEGDYQVVFVDTPGIHKISTALDKYMQKSLESATEDVNLLLYVLDGSKPFKADDLRYLKSYTNKNYPVFAVVNKVDLTEADKLFPELEKLNSVPNISEVFCISALEKKNLQLLKENIFKHMTDNIKYFADDQLSDKSFDFVVAEILREKMLWLLRGEVPHSTYVLVDKMEDSGKYIQIDATIFCEKENHKNIIIGSKGAKIKEIGMASRLAVEKMLGKKVNLNIWVKVKPDWKSKEGVLGSAGYGLDDLK